MSQAPPDHRHPGLLPAGRRWGTGADSVLPYLGAALRSRAVQADALPAPEQFIQNPVFVHMEHTLRLLSQRH